MPKFILKDRNGNETTYEGDVLTVPSPEGEKLPFTYGAAAQKEVELYMAEGDQVVEADEGTVLTAVTVKKPETLVPENIPAGICIAGVDGELVMPQLHAPTAVAAATVGSDGLQYFTVTLPNTNGDFAKRLRLTVHWTNSYGDETVIDKELSGVTTSANVYADDFDSQRGVYLLQLNFHVSGDGFFDSNELGSSVLTSLALVKYDLSGVTVSKQYKCVFLNDTLTMQLTAEDGYYLPKTVSTLDTDGTPLSLNTEYDYDTGELEIKYNKLGKIADDSSYFFTIFVHAVQTPWLRTPAVSISDDIMSIKAPSHSEMIQILLNDAVIAEKRLSTATYEVMAVDGAAYGFVKDGDYYVSQNKGKGGTAALCKVVINTTDDITATLNCISYGESNYDFGILSLLDKTLLTSSTVDTSNVKKSFKGLSSSSVQPVLYDVPAGEHFIYVKYRKDGSVDNNNDTLKFNIVLELNENFVDLRTIDELRGYGTYQLYVVATAEGFTESDAICVDFVRQPAITVSNGVLTISNAVPSNVTAFELYFDGELVDTITYDGTKEFSVALSDYAGSMSVQHEIHIKGIGENVHDNRSNSVTAWVIPAGEYPIYGVSGMYSSTVALTRTDDAVGMTYTINSDGSIDSDFDDVFPWNKTELVTDENGNEFVSFPQMFFRVTADSAYRITAIAVSGAPHEDGDWYEVKPFWYGRYGGSVTDSVLESKRGATRAASKTRANFRMYAKANGDGYHQLDLYHDTVLKFLWWIEWATKNSQAIMQGRIQGSGTAGETTLRPTGGTDTVTTPSGYELEYAQMRYHYIEDFIGNLQNWLDGIYTTGASTSYYDYATADPTKFSDTTSGLNKLAYSNCANGCIAAYGWDSENPFLCMPHSYVNNSSYNTYFCDQVCRITGYPAPYVGENYLYTTSSSITDGLSYMYCLMTTSMSSIVGARLLKSHFTD